jgi:hypothetical protein
VDTADLRKSGDSGKYAESGTWDAVYEIRGAGGRGRDGSRI